jgi:hypothetical protein
MPLISIDKQDVSAPAVQSQGEEKIVTVVQTEQLKKTRKLKKPSVEVTNGTFEEGMAKGTD